MGSFHRNTSSRTRVHFLSLFFSLSELELTSEASFSLILQSPHHSIRNSFRTSERFGFQFGSSKSISFWCYKRRSESPILLNSVDHQNTDLRPFSCCFSFVPIFLPHLPSSLSSSSLSPRSLSMTFLLQTTNPSPLDHVPVPSTRSLRCRGTLQSFTFSHPVQTLATL